MNILAKNKFILLLIIFILAVILYGFRLKNAPQTGSLVDDAHYIVVGESFATGHLNHLINFPDAPIEKGYSPGYSLFILSPILFVLGKNFIAIQASSFILALANILLFFFILRNKLNEPYRSLATALFALNPFIAGYATVALSETSFIFFILVFTLLFEYGLKKNKSINAFFIFSILAISMVFWIRYWGIAFFLAASLYLALKRNWQQLIVFVSGFLVCVIPLWLILLPGNFESYFASTALNRAASLQNLLINLKTSIIDYWGTIPYVIFPAVGPTILSSLASKNLAWLMNVVNFAFFAFLGIGLWTQRFKTTLYAWYVLAYLALIFALTGHYGEGVTTKDESRYIAILLPFLYFFLFGGILKVLEWILTRRIMIAKTLMILIGIFMILVSISRNYRDMRSVFNLPDLSTGAKWIQNNTPSNAVIMTSSSVERYLYINRKSMDYPNPDQLNGFMEGTQISKANYIMITPPILLNYATANTQMQYTPYMENSLLPAIQGSSQRFVMVYEDTNTKTRIFEIRNP